MNSEEDEWLADSNSRPPGVRSAIAKKALGWLVKVAVLFIIADIVSKFVTAESLNWGTVAEYLFDESVLTGVGYTLLLTAAAMILGCLIGLVLALMRLTDSLFLDAAAELYIWIFRGTPLLVQILFWYNLASFLPELSVGIPFGPQLPGLDANEVITPLTAAILGLGLNEGAYMSEIFRAGIQSVDSGQSEASAALGMSRSKTMRRIVLPQAMRVILPPTGNQVISMLKSTSLVSIIAITELLYTVQVIYARTFETIPLLIVACIWYLALTTVLSIGQHYLEKYFSRGASRSGLSDSLLAKLQARLRVGQRLAAGRVSS